MHRVDEAVKPIRRAELAAANKFAGLRNPQNDRINIEKANLEPPRPLRPLPISRMASVESPLLSIETVTKKSRPQHFSEISVTGVGVVTPPEHLTPIQSTPPPSRNPESVDDSVQSRFRNARSIAQLTRQKVVDADMKVPKRVENLVIKGRIPFSSPSQTNPSYTSPMKEKPKVQGNATSCPSDPNVSPHQDPREEDDSGIKVDYISTSPSPTNLSGSAPNGLSSAPASPSSTLALDYKPPKPNKNYGFERVKHIQGERPSFGLRGHGAEAATGAWGSSPFARRKAPEMLAEKDMRLGTSSSAPAAEPAKKTAFSKPNSALPLFAQRKTSIPIEKVMVKSSGSSATQQHTKQTTPASKNWGAGSFGQQKAPELPENASTGLFASRVDPGPNNIAPTSPLPGVQDAASFAQQKPTPLTETTTGSSTTGPSSPTHQSTLDSDSRTISGVGSVGSGPVTVPKPQDPTPSSSDNFINGNQGSQASASDLGKREEAKVLDSTVSPGGWGAGAFAGKRASGISDDTHIKPTPSESISSKPASPIPSIEQPLGAQRSTSKPPATAWGASPFARRAAQIDELAEVKANQIETKLDDNLSYMPKPDRERKFGSRKIPSDTPSSLKVISPNQADTAASQGMTSKTSQEWRLLSKKPGQKTASKDFWNTLGEVIRSPKRDESLATQRPQPVETSQAAKDDGQSRPRPGKSGSDDWEMLEMAAKTEAKKTETKAGATRVEEDWGAEYDSLPKLRREVEQSKTTVQPQKTPDEFSLQGFEKPKSRDADDGRNRKYEEEETYIRDRTRDKKKGRGVDDRKREDRKKRQGRGRNARYREEEEEDEDDDGYDDYVERKRQKAVRKAQREAERVGPIPITLPELITVADLAAALQVEKSLFLSQLGELGFEDISLTSVMAGETAGLVAQEYGYEPTVETGEDEDLKPRPPPEDPSVLPSRPPVVTIMGHVDHGKTTLLDYLRKSSIVAQEHGGITQHIGAFSVKMSSGKPITFLDTPGHAAFLSMRQRGAYVTDIVVLVVAADDSVKPQTKEAIRHAREAKVPIIVAISKVDKDGARIDQVKNDLAANGVEIEDFGGDVQVVCVSGKTGAGMEDLEENIVLLSEILDHRAEVDGPVEGWVLESSLKPTGRAATILVKRGTLRTGDMIAAGTTWAKIRSMTNEAGVEIKEAPPGTPVEVRGWRELPAAGDAVIQAPDEKRARAAVEYRAGLEERQKDAKDHQKIAEERKQYLEQRAADQAAEEADITDERALRKLRANRRIGAWGTVEKLADTQDGAEMVNFIVKGDVHGSVEAVSASILETGNHEVRPRLLQSSAGHVTESDVELAAVSNSIIVSFNLPIAGNIKNMAEKSRVRILEHNIIYRLSDEVKSILSERLAPEVNYSVAGEAEVLQVFPINIKGRKHKNIAGCRVRNGKLEHTNVFRVIRNRETLYEGKLESFKHLKKDITEAKKGSECGLGFEEFQDFQVGDQIQALEEIKVQRNL